VKVLTLLPDAPVPPDSVVPLGWVVSPGGIVPAAGGKTPELLTPVVMVECGRDAHRGTETLTLAFPRDGAWRRLVVDRRDAADAHAIVRHASAGLPVTSNNARLLVQYLSEYEAANRQHCP